MEFSQLISPIFRSIVQGSVRRESAPDERTIYFYSYSAMSGAGTSGIWMATRASTADPFRTPTPVSELNQAGANTEPAWISNDGCVLYFDSARAGNTRTSLSFDASTSPE